MNIGIEGRLWRICKIEMKDDDTATRQNFATGETTTVRQVKFVLTLEGAGNYNSDNPLDGPSLQDVGKLFMLQEYE